ncbi:MAG: NAD(P)H-binding protein [Flavicella sp.]
MGKTAIILGATGLTGGFLLQELLEDVNYSHVKIFARNSLSTQHEKVTEYIGDLLNLEGFQEDFTADEVFCCIGTTLRKTPDKTVYKKIDYGIPVTAAKLCKANNIPTLSIISSLGANANSSFFYPRTKGEMEVSVLSYEIQNTFLLQPSFITGNRNEKRFLENLGFRFTKLFSFLMVGPLKKFKSISAASLAKVMHELVQYEDYPTKIISSDQIQKLIQSNT